MLNAEAFAACRTSRSTTGAALDKRTFDQFSDDNRGMLRFILLPACLVGLSACTVVPPQAYSFDPTHPQPKPVADATAIAPLTNRVAGLQLELDKVRDQIANQPDTWKRLALYVQENEIHAKLGPAQRELAQYASAR